MDKLKWYENNSLESIENIIRDNIGIVSESFNAIGYYLKNVRDRKLHIEAGYSSILEYAHQKFNISQSWASRWMDINDRFSVDGNSPMLQEKYKNFDRSVLAEMLTLTDEQLEQLPLTTTRAEIRDIKKQARKKEKLLAPAQTKEEQLPDQAVIDVCQNIIPAKTNVFEEAAKSIHVPDVDKRILNDVAKWCIGKLKDTLQLQIKVNGFDASMEQLLIMNLQTKALRVTNNYDLSFGKTYVKITDHKFDKTENLLYMDIDQEIHRIWFEEIKNSEDEEMTSYHDELESVIDEAETVEADIIEPETISPRNDIGKDEGTKDILRIQPTRNENDPNCPAGMGPRIEGCNWKPSGLTANDAEWICRNCWSDYLRNLISSDRDVKEPLVIDEPEVKHKYQIDPKDERFERVPHQINTAWKFFDEKDYDNTDFYLFNARKDLWENEKYEFDRHEPFRPEFHEGKSKQPELPILKNNDQRKEFIEAYPTWPLWIDSKHTEERYYRYEFENGEAFVIRARLHYKYFGWDKGGYSKTETEYNHEEYWIVKPDKLFSECEASKSVMIDYLKEFQKK